MRASTLLLLCLLCMLALFEAAPLPAQEAPETPPTELTLAPDGFALEGRVLNGDNPIRGALVRIVGDEGLDAGAILKADADGRFAIRGLTEGRHDLGISHPQADGGEPKPWEIAYHTVEIARDLQRDFQLHVGRELEVHFTFPPGHSDKFLAQYDRVRLILSEWPREMGDVRDREDRRRVTGFSPSRLSNGSAHFRGLFKGAYVVELYSTAPPPRPPDVILPELVHLDTIEAGDSIQVTIPPPGRLEFHVHGDIEALTDRQESLYGIISPEAARDFAELASAPLAEGKAVVDPMPAGRYVFAPLKPQINSVRGAPVVFDPAASAFEIREGETTIVEIGVKAARIAEFSYYPEEEGAEGEGGLERTPSSSRSNGFASPVLGTTRSTRMPRASMLSLTCSAN